LTSPDPSAPFAIPLEPEPFYGIFAAVSFLLGLFFGSFYNVAIYRVPAGLSINHPRRSFCFRCGTQIPWQHNIPVLSYFLLRGRCGQCGASYSMRYAGVEFLTGLLFLAVFVGANPVGAAFFNWATIWYLAFASLLLIGTFTDLDHWIIPDGVTIGGTVAAIGAALAVGFTGQSSLLSEFGPLPVWRLEWRDDGFILFQLLMMGPTALEISAKSILWWEPLVNAIAGGAFGFGLLYSVGVAGKVLFGKEAMGFGDVKLFAMIGATLGVVGALLAFLLACFVGSALGIVPMLTTRGGALLRRLRGLPPAVPVSVLQKGLELFPVEEGDESTAGKLVLRQRAWFAAHGRPLPVHHMPFGPSIAIGALVVVIFQHPLREAMIRWIT
jgi:prepilin signal peptidase PulO-like enzyme (type II secretory pathway)